MKTKTLLIYIFCAFQIKAYTQTESRFSANVGLGKRLFTETFVGIPRVGIEYKFNDTYSIGFDCGLILPFEKKRVVTLFKFDNIGYFGRLRNNPDVKIFYFSWDFLYKNVKGSAVSYSQILMGTSLGLRFRPILSIPKLGIKFGFGAMFSITPCFNVKWGTSNPEQLQLGQSFLPEMKMSVFYVF